MKITTNMVGNESAAVRHTRLKSVYDWYKGDGAYVAAGNLGVVRTAFNDYLTSDIANLEPFASWAVKFNILNSPDTMIRAQLFGSGAKGVWFDPNDLPTLTQDSAGTVPVTAVGQPVGRMLDKSGNAAHATQAVAAKRPIYGIIPKGGRRNLLSQTYDLSLFNVNGSTNPALNGNLGGEPAYLLTDSSAADFSNISRGIPTAEQIPGVYTLTARVKKEAAATSAATIRVGIQDAGPNIYAGCSINPITGGLVGSNFAYGGRVRTVSDRGDYWLVTVAFTLATGHKASILEIFPAHDNLSGDGSATNVGSNTWAAPQLEFGAESPYQRVVSVYNITESGVPSLPYLASDLIDDELPAAVPSLGSNATVWFAVDGASTILTGQTVAAGQIETLRGARTYTMGAIDRPLSAGETATLTTYLDKARGAL